MSDSAGARPTMGGRQIKVAALEKPESGLGPVTPRRLEPKISATEPLATAADELAPAERSITPRTSRDGYVAIETNNGHISAPSSAAGSAKGESRASSNYSIPRSGDGQEA